ncbi:SRPBCC family protein [Streptomyces sp. NBC_00582]|uniref:SRPBCC family protein n=1 Tax=Streptomyces sp. NBC_00582 TaxID=2975783 RepID=UPI002E81505C|nr:SRPBCC domain-containing protein [Streptomyces sp. NBC_00582]WUB63045.1 SRPBCC domain-containing protein [Streptomyces sp. NBC_00582]
MEQEVFVPVPAERLRAALADPAQVARAVPGLQQDAGTEPVAGRLRVRIGGHTITYRGAVRVLTRADGAYAVEGDATEARGGGTVKLTLLLRLRETGTGTTLHFSGTVSATGRLTELPADQVTSTTTRLLNRFAESLGAGAGAAEDAVREAKPEGTEELEDPEQTERPTGSAEPAGPPESAEPAGPPESAEPAESADPGEPLEAGDPLEPGEPLEAGDPLAPGEPPAEAAHARRTMIGRSAEEVDHAPPRGRYAPVPAPQTVAPNSTLRWAAPAAALVVASAIVVGRALRRRR